MIRSVLRLLVILSVLAFPVIASQKVGPSAVDVPQASSFVVADIAGKGCLMPPSFCALCVACLAVMPDNQNPTEIAQRTEPFARFNKVFVGVLGVPKPVPP